MTEPVAHQEELVLIYWMLHWLVSLLSQFGVTQFAVALHVTKDEKHETDLTRLMLSGQIVLD